jgi:hypothetical protein
MTRGESKGDAFWLWEPEAGELVKFCQNLGYMFFFSLLGFGNELGVLDASKPHPYMHLVLEELGVEGVTKRIPLFAKLFLWYKYTESE